MNVGDFRLGDTIDEKRIASRTYQREWRRNWLAKSEENRQKARQSCLKSYRKQKAKLFALLGGKCAVCGFADERALQVDHINGGGSEQRTAQRLSNKLGLDHYKQYVKMSVSDLLSQHQLLCANCNWIKRAEKGECVGGHFYKSKKGTVKCPT